MRKRFVESPFTLILHENGAFRKLSSNRRNLKTPTLRFSLDGKHFGKWAFRKRWHYNKSCDFPVWDCSRKQIQMIGDCRVFKFLRRSVEGGLILANLRGKHRKKREARRERRSRLAYVRCLWTFTCVQTLDRLSARVSLLPIHRCEF